MTTAARATYFVEKPDRTRGQAKRVWIVVHGAGMLGDGAVLVKPGESFQGVAYADLTPGEWHGPVPMTYVGP